MGTPIKEAYLGFAKWGWNGDDRFMRCRTCGGTLRPQQTDVPFKTGATTIVILKWLPVLQCGQCGEIELEQATMHRVEELIWRVGGAELAIIQFAA